MTFRGALIIAQVLGIVIAACVASEEIETILASGPLLSVSGLWIAGLAYRRRAPAAFAYGLLLPTFAWFCFLLIFTNDWGPSEARQPIASLSGILAFAAVPFAYFAYCDIDRKPVSRGQRRIQFRISTMLAMTAAFAVVLGMLRALEAPAIITVLTLSYGAVVGYFACRLWHDRGGTAAE